MQDFCSGDSGALRRIKERRRKDGHKKRWHIHEGDGETFLILSGEGEFNDNGTVTTVRAGDVCFTGDGEGHSLKNLRDEPLEYVALVLYR